MGGFRKLSRGLLHRPGASLDRAERSPYGLPGWPVLALAIVVCSGCASRDFSIRTLPPETPAGDIAAALEAASATTAASTAAAPAAESVAPPITAAEAPPLYTYDPWERMNRFLYRFNARFDEAVFLPVSDRYRRMPAPVRAGVHNFFANLSEIDSAINYGLQLRLGGGLRSTGRFIVNSIVGIGGLFDVATRFKLRSPPTGFAATLSTWGCQPGPYLVMPLLGPSTLRDGTGDLADFGIAYGVNVANLQRGNKTYALGAVNAVDRRSNTSFRYFATGSPFEYETIRFLYVRRALIEDEALRRVHRSGSRSTHP